MPAQESRRVARFIVQSVIPRSAHDEYKDSDVSADINVVELVERQKYFNPLLPHTSSSRFEHPNCINAPTKRHSQQAIEYRLVMVITNLLLNACCPQAMMVVRTYDQV